MATICPTVLATNSHTFRSQIERVCDFASRIQIDLTDGEFAPSKTVSIDNIWWPEGVFADIHLMYKQPTSQISRLVKLHPSLVIVHAEADGNFITIAETLRSENIRVGVALLPKTSTAVIKPALDYIDHVLIFAGHLGYFGGQSDLSLKTKAEEVKALKSSIEVGWDGGINDTNATELVKSGVDVLNVGSFIQKSENPKEAYTKLVTLIKD